MTVVGSGAVVLWALALAFIDIQQRRLPNVLTVSGAAVILVVAAGVGRGLPALLGALTLGGLYLVVHLADPRALGGGDVKLAVGLGGLTAALSMDVWVLAALGAPVLTALVGVVSLVRGRGGAVPHGPSMVLSSLAAASLAIL